MTICLLFLVSSLGPLANPSPGVMPLLSANFALLVSTVCIFHSRLGLTSIFSGSTTGISDDVTEDKLSSAERRYQNAMSYLVGRDTNDPTKTRVDLYRQKQTKYTEAFERKTKAFNDALQQATSDPRNTTPTLQRAAYDKWVSENYKTYNNFVQAAYMDWVTMGKKEEVEYYFSIVDNDSAMSRVEASKVRVPPPLARYTRA